MKINFPDSLDKFNLRPDRLAKNSAESTPLIRMEDMLYAIDELEKKVGANDSTDSASLDSRVSALEDIAAVQSATVSVQRSAVAAVQGLMQALSFRSNKSAVAAAGTVIVFASPLKSDYLILGNCYNAAGELVGYVISDQSPGGFTVTPDQDGTFEWVAMQIN